MTDPDPRAGQEAARLLAAAQDWLRTSAPHLAPVAEDGEPCSCPLCRAVAGIRDADPDIVGRWVDSAVAAVTSLATQLAEQTSPSAAAADDRGGTEDDHDAESPERTDIGAVTGQDEPRARGVRRIPLERDQGPASG
jgi:hypothetical protein